VNKPTEILRQASSISEEGGLVTGPRNWFVVYIFPSIVSRSYLMTGSAGAYEEHPYVSLDSWMLLPNPDERTLRNSNIHHVESWRVQLSSVGETLKNNIAEYSKKTAVWIHKVYGFKNERHFRRVAHEDSFSSTSFSVSLFARGAYSGCKLILGIIRSVRNTSKVFEHYEVSP
jgi:hypothetical protein